MVRAQETLMRAIPTDQLAYEEAQQIGTGAFKTVYRGTLSRPNRQPQPVAVLKVRAGNCTAEAATLARLGRHTRLVKYLGQCSSAEGGQQLLVTEFAPLGGLDSQLEQLE